MAGTLLGGLAAAAKNKALYGEDFYKRIGAKGGAASTTGGFWKDRELAARAGAIGGTKSRRNGVRNKR